MSGKNPDNPKPVGDFNIPSDKTIPKNKTSSLYSADIHHLKAQRYQSKGHFLSSKKSFLKSFHFYLSSHDKQGLVQTALGMGDVCRQLEQYQEAKKWYQKAKSLSNQKSDARDADCGLALCHRAMGHWGRALGQLKNLLSRYQKSQDREGTAYVHWALGSTYRFSGRLSDAVHHNQRSLLLSSQLKDRNGMAYALCSLGGSFRINGKAQVSGKNYKKASSIFQKQKDLFGMAYSACGQGNAYRMLNQYAKSRMFFNKAIRLYQSLKQKGPLAYVLWNQSQVMIKMREKAKAKKLLLRAGQLFSQVSDKRGLIYVLLGWGEFYNQFNRGKAPMFFRNALAQSKKFNLPLEALHAESRLVPKFDYQKYARCGVNVPSFRKYKTFP